MAFTAEGVRSVGCNAADQESVELSIAVAAIVNVHNAQPYFAIVPSVLSPSFSG